MGGTFNQGYFSGVTVSNLYIGGNGVYNLTNGTLNVVAGQELLGVAGPKSTFNQGGGFHYASLLSILTPGTFDLRGGQLGGNVQITGGTLNQIAIPRVTPGLPSELLTQRPDIRRQEAQLASATANVGSARAQFFPSIQLTGQGGYQSSALSALFQPHAAFFSLVGSATQPIFDGGRILGNFELTKARQDELLQTYRKTVVQSFADVDNALMSIRQTTIKLRLQRDVVAASRRAFQLSEQQLRAGTADIVSVLNTQLTLFQAEDALSQAQLARLLAIVSLYQALGGGWEPRMERPVDAL